MAVSARPFVPSFLRSALSGSRPLQLTFNDVKDTNISSTSSFIYDPLGSPLKSTQQLNVDYSKFENHTFFMSAEAKVNLAFDQIINGYPFDGTRAEVEKFFDTLTGFDDWVFSEWPKFRGQLHFSGTQVGEDTDGTLGTWIQTKDHVGALFPELSSGPTGQSVLSPALNDSMTIETQLFIPTISTDGPQVILQKLSGSSYGFSLYLEATGSTELVTAHFSVVSGSSTLTTSTDLQKGVFNHIAVILNREQGAHFLQFYNNGEVVDTSRDRFVINDMSIGATDLYIGTGSALNENGTVITPTQTLSGTLDELRIWHSARTNTQLQEYSRKAVFTNDDLKLYYRFNEPPPPLTENASNSVNRIVIDSSGNALHALVNNFTGSLREDVTEDALSRMIYEKDQTAPVLFTAYQPLVDLNVELLASASTYDAANPNLITKLIPEHYFLEGQALEGFSTLDGAVGDQYTSDGGMPGQGQKGSVQLLLSFLYIYARFFDELKLFIDSFRNLQWVDYETNDTIPNNMLLDIAKQFGFNLPPLFNDSNIEQYVQGENINFDISTSELPLRAVQSELLRRTLINMPDVLRSKGTQHSIKSFLRSIGIDPENSMRIREFGGPTTRQLSFARESKREPAKMVQFTTSSFAITPPLSASRLEPGFPEPSGSFVLQNVYSPNGISAEPNDGLLTSGSWTVEAIVKWTPANIKAMTSTTQSLARLIVTGSNDSEGGIVANLLTVSSSINPKLLLYVRSGVSSSSPTLRMEVPLADKGLFDSERWNVSFGCERNDAIDSRVSSSYFLRVATQANGKLEQFRSTSSFFYEIPDESSTNVFRAIDSTYNVSGTFLAFGEGQEVLSGTGGTYAFLNDTAASDLESRVTNFTGLISHTRFWSKALSEPEWKEHVRNFKSRGVQDPLVNFNFVTTRTGSFEKLRLETFVKQEDVRADATGSLGRLIFLDFSQNNNHVTGSGFPIEVDTLRGEIFDYSYLSPIFDEASTNEKIRARSYFNQALVDETPWAQVAPIHEIVKSEEPTDDVRFAIEFSLIDALNRDIVTIFATLDAMDNAIGAPELLFSSDYPDLDRLRTIYFNRISDKLNFKSFFEFFRWFDTTVGTFINQLVPRKTAFKGTNFVIESHMLERHKLEYLGNEQYLSEGIRNRIKDVLLLQQITGKLSKY